MWIDRLIILIFCCEESRNSDFRNPAKINSDSVAPCLLLGSFFNLCFCHFVTLSLSRLIKTQLDWLTLNQTGPSHDVSARSFAAPQNRPCVISPAVLKGFGCLMFWRCILFLDFWFSNLQFMTVQSRTFRMCAFPSGSESNVWTLSPATHPTTKLFETQANKRILANI